MFWPYQILIKSHHQTTHDASLYGVGKKKNCIQKTEDYPVPNSPIQNNTGAYATTNCDNELSYDTSLHTTQ